MINEKTLKELLENPAIKEVAPYAIKRWDLSQEEFYNWTLQEIGDKVGWRNVGHGLERLLEIAGRGEYCYKLYSEKECAELPEKESTCVVRIPSDDPAADEKPFILLIPGGGFVNVWNLTEGWPLARDFNDLGYHVFILTYRVGVEASAAKAMEDISRALNIIAEKSAEFHVNPQSYITCGFSAGGYVTCLWNTDKGYRAFNLSKPQASFPIYPVTSCKLLAEDRWDKSRDLEEFARACVGVSIEEACNSSFEVPEHVEGFPKTAIFLAAEDELVPPEHSKILARALDAAGIPCRLEIGATGGHGFADGRGMCMEGWPSRAIDWYEGEQ